MRLLQWRIESESSRGLKRKNKGEGRHPVNVSERGEKNQREGKASKDISTRQYSRIRKTSHDIISQEKENIKGEGENVLWDNRNPSDKSANVHTECPISGCSENCKSKKEISFYLRKGNYIKDLLKLPGSWAYHSTPSLPSLKKIKSDKLSKVKEK